ncbi:hypothetical protein [Agrococcus sp. SGAir0287]|uniref:hypothetical protein n=1 Tax=Agrococcus sp. SGAir0287 TaxID=2070347 RepID=UPI0010CCFF58|nr:hypothetical protein [Agrococcus sp. SGAir0287]QCR18549.1 hypothetical protein C1N71_03030 [Agrococcus sp. SGAir0287]
MEAVDAGRRVVLVGHPLLGSEAVRRRVTHTMLRTTGATPIAFEPMRSAGPGAGLTTVLSDDESLDTRRDVALPEPDEQSVMVVRLGRLTRRQFDRLADDRLARAGLHPDWLGAIGRSIIHAQSRGYPLLAAALLDDRLRPERPRRAAAAAAAIVRALEPELRSAAQVIAGVPGIRVVRAVDHLGQDAVDALLHVGIVDEVAGALVVPAILRTSLAQRSGDRCLAILTEIAEGWSRRDAATASEYIAAHRAVEAGRIAVSTSTRARLAAIAACTLVGRSLTTCARDAAAVALELDARTLPTMLAAIAAGETAIAPALLRDAHAAGFDDLSTRLVNFTITASVLTPEWAGSDLADLLPPHAELGARLRRIGELARAQAALESGDHEAVAHAAQAALVGGDPLVGVRAYGLLACDAAFRGDAQAVLDAADGVHGVVGHVQDWTRTMLAAAGRAIAETRMAARAVALPPLPLLDSALDRIVEIAATTDDSAAIAYGLLSRAAEDSQPQHADMAEAMLLDLPDEAPRQVALAAIQALHSGPDAAHDAIGATLIVVSSHVAEIVAAAEHVEGAAARATLGRCAALVDARVPAHVPLRVAAAALHARLGDTVPDVSDIDARLLSPVLRALLVLATAARHRDAGMLIDAAAGIVSARHAALTRRLLDAAIALGGDAAAARLAEDLETSLVASRRALRGSRSWIDRDILGLAAAGLTDLQISQLLDLPLGTVRSRSRAIMADLGVPERSGLAASR